MPLTPSPGRVTAHRGDSGLTSRNEVTMEKIMQTIRYNNPWTGATVTRDLSQYTEAHVKAMANAISDEQTEAIHSELPHHATPADWIIAAKRILTDDEFDSMMGS